jgi:hypothetical protein
MPMEKVTRTWVGGAGMAQVTREGEEIIPVK